MRPHVRRCRFSSTSGWAIATSISAFELTSVAQRIDGDTFRSFEVYFTITVLYLLLSWFVMSLFALISRAAFTYPTR